MKTIKALILFIVILSSHLYSQDLKLASLTHDDSWTYNPSTLIESPRYEGRMMGIDWIIDVEVYCPEWNLLYPLEMEFNMKLTMDSPVLELNNQSCYQMRMKSGRINDEVMVRLIPRTDKIIQMDSDTIYYNFITKLNF